MTQPKVTLISLTQPVVEGVSTAEELVVYTARVSNPGNQMNMATAPKLIKYLLDNAHYSPFEQVSFGVEIVTSRAIATQILRHKSMYFSEFCIAGDSEIYFDTPYRIKKGKKGAYKMKIKDLYRKWTKDSFLRSRIANMHLRFFDTKTQAFGYTKIREVFSTGQKEVFKITLSNGRSITSTKEHKFLTKEGFAPLEQIVGLEIAKNGKATMTKLGEIACNGQPAYRNLEWLAAAKERCIENKTGVPGIATEAGVSYHTIRKWLKILKLQFSKKETASIYSVWNKGHFGYKNGPVSEATREKMRKSAKRGSQSNLWRGGVERSFRRQVCEFVNSKRSEVLKRDRWTCNSCKCYGGKLEIHHIQPVYQRPDLACDINNLQVLCRSCHDTVHKTHAKEWRERHLGNTVIPRWAQIEKIEYIGVQPTYDIEVHDESHNYVANGIVTHNSQRYAKSATYVEYPARSQDPKNRQNSVDDMDESDKSWFSEAQKQVWDTSFQLYEQALDRGVAKEQARFLLPLNTQTTLYMTGNLRDWIFYLKLRSANGTQTEHADIAKAIIRDIVVPRFPNVATALGWKND